MYSSLMNPVFIQEVLVLIDGSLKMKITILKKANIRKRFKHGAHSEVKE